MNKELEKQLQEKFPKQFRELYGNVRETCMYFGLTCGNGWHGIIEQACFQIQEELNAHPELDFKWRQIKEKFGQLVLNGSPGNERIYEIIKKYQQKSLEICEICSTDNDEITTEGSWIRTLCKKCRSSPLQCENS
jgi:translation initiation factor 2 beta subunit (eIF-2beta)/eIF-5